MKASLYNKISPFLAAFLVAVSLSFAVEAYAFAISPGSVQGGVQQPVRVACPQILAPVCGVNGVTYDNQCIAEYLHGVPVKHQGPCRTIIDAGASQPPVNPVPPPQLPCVGVNCFRPPGNPVCDPTWTPPCIPGVRPPIFNPPANPIVPQHPPTCFRGQPCFGNIINPQIVPAPGYLPGHVFGAQPVIPRNDIEYIPSNPSSYGIGRRVGISYIPTNPSSYGFTGGGSGISYIPSNPSSYGVGGGSGVSYIPTNPGSYGYGGRNFGSYLPVSPWSYGFR